MDRKNTVNKKKNIKVNNTLKVPANEIYESQKMPSLFTLKNYQSNINIAQTKREIEQEREQQSIKNQLVNYC